MLSNSSKYALKGVLYLAVNASESKKILAKDVAEPINVPPSYIAKLLQKLSKHGFVSSAKGPRGGFYLNDANLKTHLIDIVDIIDGEERLRSCMLSIRECDEDNPCPMHDLVGGAKTRFLKNLEDTTVLQLVEGIENGETVLPL